MYKENIIYSIIPARSGSKSIKDKNIIKIHSKPLIQYTIDISIKSKYVDRTFVLTDSSKYANISKKLGAEIPYLRSNKVSKDSSTDFETIYDFLIQIKKLNIKMPNFLIHLRPTSPMRKTEIIDNAIFNFISSKTYTSLRSINEMDESAYKTAEIKNNILVTSFNQNKEMDNINNPRKSFPKTYFTNGYVDILRVSYILKNKKIHGNKVFPFKTEDPCDIDDINKLKYFKFLLNK